MEKVSWLQKGNEFQRVEGTFNTIESIPSSIYNLKFNNNTGCFYLEKYAEKFVFDYKIYGLETKFCQHVLKTFNDTKGNFGIMLTGIKGTGKTVTAKVLANDFNLPIVIVKDMDSLNQDMIEFIGKFNFECVLFFDEFEKNFDNNDSTVLQIMDGVYNSNYRKIFLLTTNELKVNENLLGRPSRIRYVRTFGNLSLDIVEEYLNDNLKYPEIKQDLINYIDTLHLSTIDILKALVNEVNIHGVEGFNESKQFFNVETIEYEYCAIRGFRFKTDFESEEYKEKYSISNFVTQACEYRANRRYPEEGFLGFQIEFINSNIKFNNLKVGNTFNNEDIIQIDYKRKVVVTEYYDDYYFYYITNADEKPSLYNSKISRVL